MIISFSIIGIDTVHLNHKIKFAFFKIVGLGLLFQCIQGVKVTHIKTLSASTANHLAFIPCTRSPFF